MKQYWSVSYEPDKAKTFFFWRRNVHQYGYGFARNKRLLFKFLSNSV